jgi:hypothetical protein
MPRVSATGPVNPRTPKADSRAVPLTHQGRRVFLRVHCRPVLEQYPASRTLPHSPFAWIAWAAYLACSWTWCIGMFLPILLLRDFGMGGYVAFALPNVIGAAAMGWVLTGRQSAAELVRRHFAFIALFSLVTIAFHAYFLVWLSSGLFLFPAPWLASGVLLVILMSVVVASLRPGWQAVMALLIVIATAITAAVLLVQGNLIALAPEDALMLNRLPQSHLALFLGVSIFGFALCPYLDLTFNQARSALPQWEARGAFALGFGIFFLGMILLTLAYSGLFLGGAAPTPRLVALHIFVQSAFTIGVHLRALAGPMLPRPIRTGCLGAVVIATLVVLFASLIVSGRLEPVTEVHQAQGRGIGWGETLYRLFMGFYGLAFPAYVWLCMIPTRAGVSGPSRAHLRIWGVAVGIAIPMFWMAFIGRQTWWIAPALVIVLAARLLIPRRMPGRSRQGLLL